MESEFGVCDIQNFKVSNVLVIGSDYKLSQNTILNLLKHFESSGDFDNIIIDTNDPNFYHDNYKTDLNMIIQNHSKLGDLKKMDNIICVFDWTIQHTDIIDHFYDSSTNIVFIISIPYLIKFSDNIDFGYVMMQKEIFNNNISRLYHKFFENYQLETILFWLCNIPNNKNLVLENNMLSICDICKSQPKNNPEIKNKPFVIPEIIHI